MRGNLARADECFAESHRLWRAGSDPESLLDEVRPLDLEASLRREQRRFPEAHALLDEGLSTGPSGPITARLLLKKAKTYEEEKDYERAVATLHQAAPHAEAAGDPRLLWALRLNLLENLLQLGRFGEAEPMLPGIRDLARQLDKALDQLAVRAAAITTSAMEPSVRGSAAPTSKSDTESRGVRARAPKDPLTRRAG